MTTLLLLTIARYRHCKAQLNCTDNREKDLVRRVVNPWPALPRERHHKASLQRPTPVRKQPRNLQTEEEIRTLPVEKLIVLTSFPQRRREKTLQGRQKNLKLKVSTCNLKLLWMPCCRNLTCTRTRCTIVPLWK
jgi:hypothetical protein